MVFQPLPCKTRWEGLIVTSWIVLIDVLLLTWMVRRPVDWLSFVLLVVVVASIPPFLHLSYRTWGAFNLEYWVDRDAMTIRWGGQWQIIPMGAIQRIVRVPVDDLAQATLLDWPAPFVRPGKALGVQQLFLYATRPLPECILLDTGATVFALSPARPEAFLAAVQSHYRLGPAHVVPLEKVQPLPWHGGKGLDSIGLGLLVAGLLGVLLLFGVLMVPYPGLPDLMAFHYNAEGIPDVIREKGALFLLPTIGLTAYLLNALWGLWMLYRDQRAGAYMLWSGTLIVQAFTLLALIGLIG
jgi:hypothetical protein